MLHKQNGGVSSARNIGMDAACGEYIMFLDSDDELAPDCMSTLLDVLQKNQADIVSGGWSGETIAWREEKEVVVWKKDEALKKSLMDNPYTYSVWAKLFKKECVGNVRFCTDVRVNEDSLFVFEVLCRQPVFVGLKKVIYQYNYNPESASRAVFSEKYFDILRVSDFKYNVIQEQFPDFIEYAKNMQLKAQMNMLHLLALCEGNQYKSLKKELLGKVKQNRKYFIPEVDADKKWLRILDFNLYYAYKVAKKWMRRVSAKRAR